MTNGRFASVIVFGKVLMKRWKSKISHLVRIQGNLNATFYIEKSIATCSAICEVPKTDYPLSSQAPVHLSHSSN